MQYHKYTTTYESTNSLGNVTASIECLIIYGYYPGCPDYFDRYVGSWQPGNEPDLEIIDIKQEVFLPGEATTWKNIEPGPLYNQLSDWVMENLYDELVQNAIDNLAQEE